MDKLKKKIVRAFVALSFLISVLLSIIDSMFNEIIEYLTTSGQMTVAIILFFATNISVFILFAYMFVRLISKNISEEANRIAQQNNLLYANIAHDLKTPITTIIGFSRALKDGIVKDEAKKKDVELYYPKIRTDR